MSKNENPKLVTRDGKRIHLIHDRANRQSFGYVMEPAEDGRNVHITVARSICAERDNFNKKVAASILKSRLDAGPVGSNQHRVFSSTIAMAPPADSKLWRELDQTVVGLADLKLTSPELVRLAHNEQADLPHSA